MSKDGKPTLPPTKKDLTGRTLYLAADGNYYLSSIDTYAAKIKELGTRDSIDNWHWVPGENGAPQTLARNSLVPRLESRRVENLARKLTPSDVAALVALAQTLVHYTPGDVAAAPVQVFGEQTGGTANTTSQTGAIFDGLWWHTGRRNGNAAAGRLERAFGSAPIFHQLVDPGTGIVPTVIIFEDYVSATIAVGACETAVGFLEHITAATAATLVGVGFRAGADHIWHTFVNDCPGSVLPVTVRRDTAIAGKLSTNSHRLTVIIDGRTKTIIWLIDRVEVDRWTPGAALDQMGASPGPKMIYTICVPALGDATLRVHAGGQPQLRVLQG